MRINYTITPEILNQISAISQRLGEVKALFLDQMDPLFREENRIDSIHATLRLEGKRLSREKAAAISKQRAVREPKKLIQEVYNTNRVYEMLPEFNPLSQDSFQKAHHEMVAGSDTPIGYRTMEIAIFHRHGPISMAPPPVEVKPAMKELFHYLRHGKDPVLIKSCILHYYIVFIQPFNIGNDRMSRLWQTLLLMKEHPVFEFLPFE
ncbi:MAG: Fic family protein, partial [Bacteroidota bacterium]